MGLLKEKRTESGRESYWRSEKEALKVLSLE
jgi:hypothetical protein